MKANGTFAMTWSRTFG